MSLYLLINAMIIAFPLSSTLLPIPLGKEVRYQKRLPPLLISIAVVGLLFIAWDAYATASGHWHFNPDYVLAPRILALPIEEILFFVTVPFSCLFLYESSKRFLPSAPLSTPPRPFLALGALLLLSGPLALPQAYTAIAISVLGAVVMGVSLLLPSLWQDLHAWRYLALCFLMFLIFNQALTSIPIVLYSDWAISGLRIGTIPVEDFLFNLSLLLSYLLVYRLASRHMGLDTGLDAGSA